MICIYCEGNMTDNITTNFKDLGTCIAIIKNVPCLTCDQCGETVFTGAVARKLEQIVQTLNDSSTEVAIIHYVKTDKAA